MKYNLRRVASSAPERLARADNEATFHAFNTIFDAHHNKNRASRDLLAENCFIIAALKDIESKFARYTVDLTERTQRIVSALEQSADTVTTLEYSMRIGGPHMLRAQTPLHDGLIRMQAVFNRLRARPVLLQQVFTSYVNPLQDILLDERQQSISIVPGVDDLLIQLKGVTIAFSDLKKSSKNFQLSFDAQPLRLHTANLTRLLVAINQNIGGVLTPLPVSSPEPNAGVGQENKPTNN